MSMSEAANEVESFTDPVKFQEMLDQASQTGEPEQEEAVADEEEYTQEADAEAPEEAEDQAEDETEEEKELSESEQKSVRYFKNQLKEAEEARIRAEERAAIRDQQMQQLLSRFDADAQAGEPEPELDGDYEPLDEVADKKYGKQFEELTKKQQEIVQQQQNLAFQSALQFEEQQARAKYADFDDAFNHYQGMEIERFKALGYPEGQAEKAAGAAVAKLARATWEAGRPVGDMFYQLAKVSGFGDSRKQQKQGINPEAIAKNKAKTEKKAVDNINPAGGGTKDALDAVEDLYKKGYNQNEIDKKFNELMKRASR